MLRIMWLLLLLVLPAVGMPEGPAAVAVARTAAASAPLVWRVAARASSVWASKFSRTSTTASDTTSDTTSSSTPAYGSLSPSTEAVAAEPPRRWVLLLFPVVVRALLVVLVVALLPALYWRLDAVPVPPSSSASAFGATWNDDGDKG